MKKRGQRKPKVKKRNSKKIFKIKQTIILKFLVFFIILLMLLIIIYVFVYESKEKEKELGGELGTLCIFCSDNQVVLSVLNYVIAPDNLTIDVNINWSAGNVSIGDFNSILIDFDMGEGGKCNHTISSNLPGFGENKTYYGVTIADINSGCLETNFSRVTNILAYAEVDIHLIQTESISDISFYKDDSRNNLIYLGNYFHALTEINYSIIESPSNANINVVVNNLTKNISISVLDGAWFGTQQFNLTASTEDGDSLIMGFNIIVIDDTRPVLNYAPEFDKDECEDFSWNKNANMTVDMDDCWDDEDGDNLDYEYGDLHDYEENISIVELSGNRIKFVPKVGFNGSTYLTFYVNDSHVRVSHRVNLYILSNNTNARAPTPPTPPAPPPLTYDLEIKSQVPSGSVVSFFVEENKRFSIIAENYEDVEWYVDDVLIEQGVLSFDFLEKNPGIYTVKVKIINGTFVENHFWEVTVEEDEYFEDKIFDVSIGQVVFYSIIVVLIIIIFLIIWLLLLERKKRSKKKNFGFGVSVISNRNAVNESSRQFNIPKD